MTTSTAPMRAARAIALALAGLLVSAGCASTLDTSSTSPLSIDGAYALSSANAYRAEHGLAALQIDQRLMQAANAQSKAMAARNRLDHDVAGRLPRRVESFGYNWTATAENIGRGYANYPAAMRGWIDSPGHRRNLLNPRVTHIGFAGARDPRSGRTYYTQIFGAERRAR